jgi:serine/threonine protein kinase
VSQFRRFVAAHTDHSIPGSPPASSAGAEVRPRVPQHELLRPIGSGAYGEVWLARSDHGVFQAVKLVYEARFSHRDPYEREFRGIQQYMPVSRTHHGLVRILHLGRDRKAGFFYYVMELGDCEELGLTVRPELYRPRTLDRELDKRGSLPARECVHLGLQLAEALHYLHSHQLVHRDIKPPNILYVHGVPKFADVGLVTHQAEPDRTTRDLGTDGFAPPEGPGTPAADVFSLGMVLYEACTGRPAGEFPAPPASAAGSPPQEFDPLFAIVRAACEPDAARRLGTAAALQTELMALHDKLSPPPPRGAATPPVTRITVRDLW